MSEASRDTRGYSTLSVERIGEVDWLTLDRPHRLNAIDVTMTAELADYFGAIAAESRCRVVLLRGAGRSFCSGLDLKDFDPHASAPRVEASLPTVIRRMRACPQPIIALLRGAATGGGLSLALASDVRIAAPSARMNVAYVKLGVSGCELGTSWFLPRTVGPSVAAELMMTGRFLDANRALATGLVSEVVAEDALDDAGRQMADEMLKASRVGLRLTKETIERVGRLGDLDAALDLEEQTQRACIQDPAFAERLVAFAQGRGRSRDADL